MIEAATVMAFSCPLNPSTANLLAAEVYRRAKSIAMREVAGRPNSVRLIDPDKDGWIGVRVSRSAYSFAICSTDEPMAHYQIWHEPPADACVRFGRRRRLEDRSP